MHSEDEQSTNFSDDLDMSGIDQLLSEQSDVPQESQGEESIIVPENVEAGHAKNYSARSNFFTAHVSVWNFTDAELATRAEAHRIEPSTEFRYLVFQREIAPTNGSLHYQGTIWWGRQVRRTAAQKTLASLFGIPNYKTVHLERTKGSLEQCERYCTKNDTRVPGTTPQKIGSPPKQGQRSDLDGVVADIKDGKTIREVAMANPIEFIKFHSGISKLQRLSVMTHRTGETIPTVHWWFGPTGCGKSRDAFTTWPADSFFVKESEGNWWCHYNGESVVLLDDYRPSMCRFHVLLRILDRNRMLVQVKGDTVPLAATTFCITTCSRPEHLWRNVTDENIAQLLRRITHIKQYFPDGSTRILKDPERPELVYVPEEPIVENYIF